MNGTTLIVVSALGMCGCLARYGIGVAATRVAMSFPWPTLVINVLGCLAMGCVAALRQRGLVAEPWGTALTAGFLGGFTTFSAFGLETQGLLSSGRISAACAYVGSSLGLGVAAVALGLFALRA